jgi:PRTRC genetic system protein B
MNDLTKRLTEDYKPVLSLVCYKSGENGYYIESHPINENGEMLEGRPLKQETLQGMMGVFYDTAATKINVTGIIPENLLYFELRNGNDYTMIWWQTESQQKLYFSDALHIPTGLAWVPAMLYMATKRSLKVYALNANTRPDEKAQLYRAPFHNVSINGSVCLGSAKAEKPKSITYQNLIKYWQDMFWLSEFTHLSTGNPTKTNVNLLWKRLMEEPQLLWSDLDELVKSSNPAKLKDIINDQNTLY